MAIFYGPEPPPASIKPNGTLVPEVYYRHLDMLEKIKPGIVKSKFINNIRYIKYAAGLRIVKDFNLLGYFMVQLYEGVISTRAYAKLMKKHEEDLAAEKAAELEKVNIELAAAKEEMERVEAEKLREEEKLKLLAVKEGRLVPIEYQENMTKNLVTGMLCSFDDFHGLEEGKGDCFSGYERLRTDLDMVCRDALSDGLNGRDQKPLQNKGLVVSEVEVEVKKEPDDCQSLSSSYLYSDARFDEGVNLIVKQGFLVEKMVGDICHVEGKMRPDVDVKLKDISDTVSLFAMKDEKGKIGVELAFGRVKKGDGGYGECRAFSYNGLDYGDNYSTWWVETDVVCLSLLNNGDIGLPPGDEEIEMESFALMVYDLIFKNDNYIASFVTAKNYGIKNPPVFDVGFLRDEMKYVVKKENYVQGYFGIGDVGIEYFNDKVSY